MWELGQDDDDDGDDATEDGSFAMNPHITGDVDVDQEFESSTFVTIKLVCSHEKTWIKY